jgi:hypothetical protein
VRLQPLPIALRLFGRHIDGIGFHVRPDRDPVVILGWICCTGIRAASGSSTSRIAASSHTLGTSGRNDCGPVWEKTGSAAIARIGRMRRDEFLFFTGISLP